MTKTPVGRSANQRPTDQLDAGGARGPPHTSAGLRLRTKIDGDLYHIEWEFGEDVPVWPLLWMPFKGQATNVKRSPQICDEHPGIGSLTQAGKHLENSAISWRDQFQRALKRILRRRRSINGTWICARRKRQLTTFGPSLSAFYLLRRAPDQN